MSDQLTVRERVDRFITDLKHNYVSDISKGKSPFRDQEELLDAVIMSLENILNS